MQDLKITIVQTTQVWEDKASNLSHFEKLVNNIEQTDIILLPEMFHTGFTMNAEELAEEMDDSIALDWLRTMAIRKNCAIYTSFIAKEDNYYFNRGIFMEPTGKYTYYDKRKLFTLAKEEKTFKAGHVKVRVPYKGWKIQLQICYDLRFPEITRNGMHDHKTAKYDALLYVANWPEKRNQHWKNLLVARAIENQCYVVGVNRIGTDGKGLVYSGDSAVINANGDIISTILPHEEKVETITLKGDDLLTFRNQLAFLKDA